MLEYIILYAIYLLTYVMQASIIITVPSLLMYGLYSELKMIRERNRQ